MKEKMTIEDVKKLAMKYYEKGGDGVIECWSDEDILKFLTESKSPKKDLLEMFKTDDSIYRDMQGYSGWDEEIEKKNHEEYMKSKEFEIENEFDEEEVEEEYTPSATMGDYSPSHPWDAPGMSIRDFI